MHGDGGWWSHFEKFVEATGNGFEVFFPVTSHILVRKWRQEHAATVKAGPPCRRG
jgi:hypothetical protein